MGLWRQQLFLGRGIFNTRVTRSKAGWIFLAGSGKEVRDSFESKAENDNRVPGKTVKDAKDRTAFHIYIAKHLFEISVLLA